jgi:hypothetical protein
VGEFVCIGPRDDASAQQAFDWLTDLRAKLTTAGHIQVAQVDNATPANRKKITAALTASAHLILYFGHGDSDRWKTGGQATVDKANANILGPRAVVAVACKSGTQLGPDAVTAGVDTYLGFTSKVGVIPLHRGRDQLGEAIVNGLKVLGANQSMQAAKDELVRQLDALSLAFDTGRLRNHPHATFGYFVSAAMRDHVVLHGKAGLQPFAGPSRTPAQASGSGSLGGAAQDPQGGPEEEAHIKFRQLLERLIAADIDKNDREVQLFWAVENGDLELTKEALNNGANTSATDKEIMRRYREYL